MQDRISLGSSANGINRQKPLSKWSLAITTPRIKSSLTLDLSKVGRTQGARYTLFTGIAFKRDRDEPSLAWYVIHSPHINS